MWKWHLKWCLIEATIKRKRKLAFFYAQGGNWKTESDISNTSFLEAHLSFGLKTFSAQKVNGVCFIYMFNYKGDCKLMIAEDF